MGNNQSAYEQFDVQKGPKEGQKKSHVKIVVIGRSKFQGELIWKFAASTKPKNMVKSSNQNYIEEAAVKWSNAAISIYECRKSRFFLFFTSDLKGADIVLKMYDRGKPSSRKAMENKYSSIIKMKAPNAKVFLVGTAECNIVTDSEKTFIEEDPVDCQYGPIQHLIVSAYSSSSVCKFFENVVCDVFPEVRSTNADVFGDVVSLLPARVPSIVYPMYKDPVGTCLILNNEIFESCAGKTLSRRLGTQEDVDGIAEVFGARRFRIVVRNNLSSTHMLQELQLMAMADLREDQCFVCFVLSHGNETNGGSVYGTDCREVAVKKILSKFKAQDCVNLAGTPKLFFIQACQGQDRQAAVSAIVPDAVGERPHFLEEVPDDRDMFLFKSTKQGYVSNRHELHGSYFIQNLLTVMRQNPGSPLTDIAAEVKRRVSAIKFPNGYQVPVVAEDTLIKAVAFKTRE